ncbi:T9SS type A sorting domain-containing protein [Dyadobacter fermentans]|uniref:Secretion system C-terminal sorting domain-containing protein n=1 Tax=Dyadobacter fermentans (strain ATCC 700827 / DSM 18053 / CIP 107007 / KCTC 52180 / NS114) TaxID=471854 RepID=C6VT05_DYAFD|nr:T9SS type A sorting domain-containing protein [Dyadobacter fermentans]ACT94650.1 hypothetical protein Dfer_3440 [Dyadobacter fermentans DSM 18053]
MIRPFTCVFLFWLAISGVLAQNASISITDSPAACLRTKHSIPVKLTGLFQAGNQFWVQIKTSAAAQSYSQYAGTLKNGAIEVTFSDSALVSHPTLWIRIAATAPAVESNWQENFRVHGKGIITISPLLSDTLNKYDEHRFQTQTISSSDGTGVLNDSTSVRIYGSHIGPTSPQLDAKMVEKTTDFTIAHAENYCGPMQTKGVSRAVVNAVSLVTTLVSPSTICAGNTISVQFSGDGPLPAATSGWKVRLREAIYTGDDKPGGRTMELPAKRTSDNTLEITVPASFTPEFNTPLNIRVLSPGGGIVGGRGKVLLQMQTPPQVSFAKTAYTVAFGEAVLLQIQKTGTAPFRVKFSDGRDYFDGASTQFDESNPLYKKPLQTTTYSIQSVSSGCGVHTPSPAPSAKVTVLPGMLLDDLNPAKPFCEQQTARLHFVSSEPIPSSSALSMEIRHQNGEIKTLPVTRDGEFVSFKIPVFADYNTEYPRVRARFTFTLVSSSPAVRSLGVEGISIQSKPQLIFPSDVNQFEYDTPTSTRVYMEMSGGGPYDVVTSSGIQLTPRPAESLFYEALFVRQTMDFGIKSVSNACFTTTDLPKAKLVVKNPASTKPFISVLPVAFSGCHRDSLELDIQTAGTFGEGNVFRIQIVKGDNCCNYETIATVSSGGRIKLKIPGDDTRGTNSYGTENFGLRVASTVPEVIGTEYFPYLSYPLYDMSIDFVNRATGQPEFTSNGDFYIHFNSQGASIDTLVYSDGRKDFTLTGLNGGMSPFKIWPKVGSNTFTIKSVTTVCGRQEVNVSKSMEVIPYRIVMTETFADMTLCPGAQVSVPFVIQDGDASGATYSWQVRKENETTFQTIFTGKDNNRISGTIPASFGHGKYISRISAEQGPVSNEVPVVVGQAPTVSLTFPNHPNENPIVLDYTKQLLFRIDYTGSFPITTVNQYNEKQYKYETPEEFSHSPSERTTFQIKSVSNACGFGPPSQAVVVSPNPVLAMSMIMDGTACAGGKSMQVIYKLSGDYDLSDSFIRFELEDPATKASYLLDSSKIASGQRAFNLPKGIKAGYYNMIVNVPKYNLKQQLSTYIHTVVDATLFGDMTISAGDTAGLGLRINNINSYERIGYALSDGTAGTFTVPDDFIPVSPSKTTTYQLVSITNQCGAGTFSGSAVVTVQARTERRIAVTNWWSATSEAFCATDTIRVDYRTRGSFSATNRFTVQLSDTTGQNFRDIPTTGSNAPLTAIVPADLPRGRGYRLRVVASDAGTSSSAHAEPLYLRHRARARFGATSIPFHSGPVIALPLQFEGDSPWRFSIGTMAPFPTREASKAQDTVFVQNGGPAVFRLLGVWNVCGSGTLAEPAELVFEEILATEGPATLEVTLSPNPSSDVFRLNFQNAAKRNVRIYTLAGALLYQESITSQNHQIAADSWPSGIYLLTIEEQQHKRSFRIFKR